MTTIAELGHQISAVLDGLRLCVTHGMLPSTLLEYQRTMHHGYCLGLREDQALEVHKTWRDRYRQTPYPTDWERIRAAMARRAIGQPWQPRDTPSLEA